MFSIRKWIAAKMMQVPAELGPPATSSTSSTSRSAILPVHMSTSRRASRSQRRHGHGHHVNQGSSSSADRATSQSECGSEWKSSVDVYASSLIKFYQADDQLNLITAELDSFDGRKDPVRCTNLVNQLR